MRRRPRTPPGPPGGISGGSPSRDHAQPGPRKGRVDLTTSDAPPRPTWPDRLGPACGPLPPLWKACAAALNRHALNAELQAWAAPRSAPSWDAFRGPAIRGVALISILHSPRLRPHQAGVPGRGHADAVNRTRTATRQPQCRQVVPYCRSAQARQTWRRARHTVTAARAAAGCAATYSATIRSTSASLSRTDAVQPLHVVGCVVSMRIPETYAVESTEQQGRAVRARSGSGAGPPGPQQSALGSSRPETLGRGSVFARAASPDRAGRRTPLRRGTRRATARSRILAPERTIRPSPAPRTWTAVSQRGRRP